MEYVIPVALGVFLGKLFYSIYDMSTDLLVAWYQTRRLQASKPKRGA